MRYVNVCDFARRSRCRLLRSAVGLVLAILAGGRVATCVAEQPPSMSKLADASIRVRFYQDAVMHAPDHYAALALLGAAYLEQARDHGDLDLLGKALESLERSVAIQPNLEAFVALAEHCLYRHRFMEGKSWIERAHAAAPGDPALLTLRVEARLGLGELVEATQLVDEARAGMEIARRPREYQFILETASGACLVSRGDSASAKAAYLRASVVAPDPDLALWSKVRAAGVELDAGRFEAAAPLLEEAARLKPHDRFLRIHQAELLEASSQPAAALLLYEQLIAEQDEADLRRRAYSLSKSLGRPHVAQFHFDRCQTLCRAVIDRGEIFTLECLASLLAESGLPDRRAEAIELARRNTEFKRDRRALNLLESLKP